jgi:hypothetical protein
VPKTGLSSLNYQTVHFLSVGMWTQCLVKWEREENHQLKVTIPKIRHNSIFSFSRYQQIVTKICK